MSRETLWQGSYFVSGELLDTVKYPAWIHETQRERLADKFAADIREKALNSFQLTASQHGSENWTCKLYVVTPDELTLLIDREVERRITAAFT